MVKRISATAFVFLIILVSLAARLYYIQIISSEYLTQSAVAQRRVSVVRQDTRGAIVDRNYYPFTSSQFCPVAVVSPSLAGESGAVFESISAYAQMPKEQFDTEFDLKLPFCVYLDDYPLSAPLGGVAYMWGQKRYAENTVARHVLGYCAEDENRGVAGLELAFDDELKTSGVPDIGVIADGKLRQIDDTGFNVAADASVMRSVRLTLDYKIQALCEQIAARSLNRGAVVVLDTLTGDVLAMVSMPNYGQVNVAPHINSSEGELINRALCAYDAGSIFKIIVAAAALESGAINLDDRYTCNGYITVGDKNITCFNGVPHGEINFFEAFAKSCNAYFITVGEKLGEDAIKETAERFGIGTTFELFDYSNEQKGGILKTDKFYQGDIANISIGQGDVQISQLRAAYMAAVIANNGVMSRVNLVDSVIDGNKKQIKNLARRGQSRVISEDTAKKIKSMMYFTTVIGTGKAANIDDSGGAALKTGTAQTGWVEDGVVKVHSWTTGFFPADNPKYAVCVFAENGQNEGISAAAVFGDIAREIMK